MNVITYNILADCYTTGFKNASPEAVNPAKRFELVKNKLLPYIEKNTVILLQEVTVTQGNKLLVFFEEQEYTLIMHNYGSHWNDYMGVAIAFPKIFVLERVDRCRIGSLVNRPVKKKQSICTKLADLCRYGSSNPTDDKLVEVAYQRSNFGIAILLNMKGHKYWFATYHFPCAFKTPKVMDSHAKACLKWLHGLQMKGSTDIIFGCDMNSTPGSPVYKSFSDHLTSAYASYYHNEPKATNVSVTERCGYFSGCLDYIWITDKIQVDTVDKIPDIIEEMPNEHEPSDHVLLAAKFVLIN